MNDCRPIVVPSPLKSAKGAASVVELRVPTAVYNAVMANEPNYIPDNATAYKWVSNPYASSAELNFGDSVEENNENGINSLTYGASSPSLSFSPKDGEMQSLFWKNLIASVQDSGCEILARRRVPVGNKNCAFDAQAFANGHCCSTAYKGSYILQGLCGVLIERASEDNLTLKGTSVSLAFEWDTTKTFSDVYANTPTGGLPFLDCEIAFLGCGNSYNERGARVYLSNTLLNIPSGSKVGKWLDTQSGSEFTQGDFAKQPTFERRTSGCANSQGVYQKGVDFDGTNDYLVGNGAGDATQSKTIIFAYVKDSTNFNLASNSLLNTAPKNSLQIEATDFVLVDNAGFTHTHALNSIASCGSGNVVAFTYNGTTKNVTLYDLQGGGTTTTFTADVDFTNLYLGTSVLSGGTSLTYANGLITDAIVAPFEMTSTEVQSVFDVLGTKFL